MLHLSRPVVATQRQKTITLGIGTCMNAIQFYSKYGFKIAETEKILENNQQVCRMYTPLNPL